MNTTDELDRLEEQAVTHAGEMIEAQRQINAERLRAYALHKLAKTLGNALMDFTPGGSEYFIQVGDDYYADAAACSRVIREKLDKIAQFAGERNDERRRAETAETKLSDARRLPCHRRRLRNQRAWRRSAYSSTQSRFSARRWLESVAAN